MNSKKKPVATMLKALLLARLVSAQASIRLFISALLFLLTTPARAQVSTEAVSREMSVFNSGQPANSIEATSREVSVFNFGQPAARTEAVSREVSLFNTEGLINQPPIIFAQPQSQSVPSGNPVAFGVTAVGSPPLSYQWFFNATNPLSGATSPSLALNSVNFSAAGGYRVVVANAHGSITSAMAQLVVVLPLGPTPHVTAISMPTNGCNSPCRPLYDNLWSVAAPPYPLETSLGIGIILNPQFIAANVNTDFALHENGNYASGHVPQPSRAVVTYEFDQPAVVNQLEIIQHFYGITQVEAFVGDDPNTLTSIGAVFGPAGDIINATVGVDGDSHVFQFNNTIPGRYFRFIVRKTAHSFAFAIHRAIPRDASGQRYRRVPGPSDPPLLLSGPSNQIVQAGADLSLAVAVDGTPPLQFQWFYNGAAIGGGNTPSLFLLKVEAAHTGNYRVVVSNAFGSVTSSVATVTVLQLPAILQQPVSQTVLIGQNVSFTVNASGSLPLTYFWSRNGLPFASETLYQHSSTIALANVQTFDSANFQVVVTNAASPSGVSSSIAALTVLAPVGIAAQPTNTTATLGGSATFCVSATGSAPIRYQWRHNGASIPGATNACLTITDVTLADGGAYQVALENAAGTLVSDSALLTFAVPDAPPGDNFADRVSLGTNSSGVARGTNSFATKEAGEPDHAGKPGGASVWYRWSAPSNGVATFRTVGSAFDTLLAVYTGQSVDALMTVASDEDDGGFFTSLLQFNAIAGTDYAIGLDGFGGAQGDFVLSWSLEATSDALPVIMAQPTSRTVTLGASTTLTVSASGSGLKYQWHFNDVALIDQTNSSLTLPSVQATNVGNYLVAVSNSAGRGLRSEVAVLEIGPVPTVQSQDKFADLFLDAGGGGGGLGPASSGGFISVSIGTTTAPQILNNTGATTQSGEADHCIVISTATRWLRYRAENAGVMVIDTFGSAIPTVLEVYADVGVFGFPVNSLACGKTNAPDGRNSRVSFGTVAGKEYYVAADGFRGAVGIIQMNAALGQSPILPTIVPTNTVIAAEESFLLGAPAPLNTSTLLRYQWQLNGRNILDATNATYLVSSADASAGGTYTVVVINEFGSVTRAVAVVGVNTPYLRGDPQLLNGVLRLWVQRPAGQAVIVEGTGNFGAWTPLQTVPLTVPGPIVDLPATNALRFFRARPWP